MKKVILSIPFLLLIHCKLYSQDLSQPFKMFYYERWQSAKEGFEKESAKSADAAYWLVETLVASGNIVDAKTAADKARAAFPKSGLVMVAKGHTLLNEGKSTDATTLFENALSIDAANKSAVLNAIGRAHANVPHKYSQPDYAIAKLKTALTLEPNNGSIYINMGDCYRKKLDGKSALETYSNALKVQPSLAAQAKYKTGRVHAAWQNCDFMTWNFNDAVQYDPNFMPAWRELYEISVDPESKCMNADSAKKYFEKYLAASDPGNEGELLRCNYAYLTKDYSTALAKAKALLQSMGGKAPVRLYKLISYCYFEQKDYANCIKWMEDYFVKEADTEKIVTDNYRTLALAYDGAGNPEKAKQTWIKAGNYEQNDTKKWFYYEQAAAAAGKMKDNAGVATIWQLIIDKKPSPTKADYFKCGSAWYNAGKYSEGLNIFKQYAIKFPDDWRAPLYAGKLSAHIDSSMTSGAAGPFYEKAISLADKNPADLMPAKQRVEVFLYLFAYNYNFKKDKIAAEGYLDKLLVIDPKNETALKYKQMLSKQQ